MRDEPLWLRSPASWEMVVSFFGVNRLKRSVSGSLKGFGILPEMHVLISTGLVKD
jgi:hypothetical protein